MGTFLSSLWIHEPSRFYFFGDSWDVLHQILTNWTAIFRPHNEHLMPLFKAFLALEYKLFGAYHLAYMVVGFALHAANATLVFVLGRRLSLRPGPAVAAALLFAFSSVHWEVTGWSFEQCFMLGTLFMLLGLYLFWERPHQTRKQVWIMILSLAALWSAPISVAFPAILTVCYLSWLASCAERVKKSQVVWTFLAMWAPAIVYLTSLLAATTLTDVLDRHNTSLTAYNLPQMVDFTLFGAAYGLILPTLTFLGAPSLASASVILVLLGLLITLCYRGLVSNHQRRAFWFLLCFLLVPFLAISVARIQFGPGQALSPRYQYLPAVALSLLIALCWQALTKLIGEKGVRFWLTAVGVALLAYFGVFHGHAVRRNNPGADRGLQTQYFLQIAKRATYPTATSQADASRTIGPELAVPAYVSAPGYFPLWKVFQVLEGNTQTIVPIGDYLRDKDASFAASLIRNGGFENSLADSPWKTYGGARSEQNRFASRTGNFGVETVLPRSGAFSQDVITSCPVTISGRILTFSVQARTNRPGALAARIIFKNYENTILETYHSLTHPGDDQWHQVLVSGLSPEETCIVGVDVTNESSSELTAMLDDALLVAHPGTVDDKGKVRFQTIEQILTPQNDN